MADVLGELQAHLDATVFQNDRPLILEAGCGSGSHIQIPGDAHVTGIDISPAELDKNTIVSVKIVGDIQTYRLPQNSFDMIVCWDVLEHLKNPKAALESFFDAIKPGGVMVLAFPNVYSVKGIVAKFTPLWFHEFVYRRIYGQKFGQPGLENFPTFLKWDIGPRRIEGFAKAKQLSIEFMKMRESGVQARFREKIKLRGFSLDLVEVLVRIFSLGQLSFKDSDCIFVLRK